MKTELIKTQEKYIEGKNIEELDNEIELISSDSLRHFKAKLLRDLIFKFDYIILKKQLRKHDKMVQ